MTTHARDAIGSLDSARKHANKQEFADARDDWTDACDAMGKAIDWNEPQGPGSEYDEAMAEAAKILDEFGKEMAAAFVESRPAEAAEKERQRLHELLAAINAQAAAR
jgi:hypothetical protein